MLRVEKHKSIHAIAPEHWDSILRMEDVFHTHQFISTVEDSKVEKAHFHYLLFYEEEKLVATTVLSVFKINLAMFVSHNWLVKKVINHFPKFFHTTILVCGLPVSLGQQNLKLREEKYATAVCAMLATEMKSLAKDLRTKLLAIKEFKQKEFLLFLPFRHHGFFAAHSMPYMKIKMRWCSFDDYLSSLRHHYRRQILLSLKKTGHTQPVILSPQEYDSSCDSPAWILYNADERHAGEFYQMYLKVMQRATTRLETLNRSFFQNLFCGKSNYKILSLVVKGKAISSALLLPTGDSLTFVLVGHEQEKDNLDSYFNLLYGVLAFAIKSGYQTLYLGQTAYWTKQCLGAEAENEYIWLGSPDRLLHWIVKKLNPYLFPETKLKKTNVFKPTKSSLPVIPALSSAEKI